MKHKTSQTGFTLIELIAVMVILGILAAVLIPRLSSVQEGAYEVNAKQMYSTLAAHLQMQAQKSAITGAHGLETFPDPTSNVKNYYLKDWLKDYDAEHWTQVYKDDYAVGSDNALAPDIIYFVYHPHEVWTGAVTNDHTMGLTIKKDIYYIEYFPVTTSTGKADGIFYDGMHLALRRDNDADDTGHDCDLIMNKDNDRVVDNMWNCDADNFASDHTTEAGEATTVCAIHDTDDKDR